MIHKIAMEISVWCRNILDSTDEERQVIQYGIEVLLDGIIKTAILLTIGYFLGSPGEFGLSLFVFCSLRYWAGGIHCKTSMRCLVAMLLLCLISTYGGWCLSSFSGIIFWVIVTFTYLVLFLGAPGVTKISLDMSNAQKIRKRIGALIWMTMEYGGALVIGDVHLKWCIVIAVTIEALSVIPCWRIKKDEGGEHYVQQNCSRNGEKGGRGICQKCSREESYYHGI